MASMTTRDDALQFGAVDWQRLIREGAVADQHAAAIKGAEASSLEGVLGDAAAARAYAAALAAVAGGVDDGAARRYCVTKAEDVLVADGAAAAKAQLFAPGGLANFVAAAGKAARAGDAYSTRVAAAVAAALVAADAQADAGPLVAWLATQMADGTSAREAAPALAVALRAPRARAAFAAQGGVALLAARLNDTGGGAQLKYEVAFSLWCLSFEEDAPDDFVRSHAVEALCGAVAAAPREKVVRVAVTALLNAARDDAAATRMVGAGLGTTLASMASRPFADDDVKAAVGELATRVKSVSKELSTLERYAAEVASGKLRWGPVHSEAFWVEHAKAAEKDDFALVRRLVEVLSEATGDVEALAVASYDLGEIAHRHAGAKSALVKLGAKDAALKLIDHEDEDVQRRALQCVSKILLRGGSSVVGGA